MSFKDANFDIYICRVLKQISPDQGMTGDGLATMNNLVRIVLQRIVQGANRVMLSSPGRKTMSSREIQTSVRLNLPGELSKHAVSMGTKAVTKYNDSKKEREDSKTDDKAKPMSRASLAGLVFPVPRIENIMVELSNAERKAETSAVYLAAVLEYISGEVLELASNAARSNKKVRVTPRHIKLAILNDEELTKLFQGVVFSGGVLPHIESALIKKTGEGAPKPKKKAAPSAKKAPAKATKKVPATKKPAAKKK